MSGFKKLNSKEREVLIKQIQAFLQVFHLILCVVIFALIVGAICGNGWLYNMTEVTLYQDTEKFIGLWQTCTNVYDYGCPTESCVNSGSDVEDYIQATRAFLILATLPSIFAFIGGIGMLCSDRVKGQVSAICHIITGVFLLIGMSVYTAKVNEEDSFDLYKYSWSFAFGWVAFVLTLIAAVITFTFGAPKLPRIIIEFRE
uniref:Claudin n=1 Tax=Clytia hemisphaerica TaxID=252671 RepID=A0A7M5UYY2_9CNID